MSVSLLTDSGTVELDESLFACAFNESLVHQIVNSHLSMGHTGTRAQKSRSDVSGGGRKPYRQKKTGRARAGTIRSPIWRGGGVTFAAKPHVSNPKINRKMYRGALRCIFSELIRQDRLTIVSQFLLETHKTKSLLSKIRSLNLNEDILIVVSEPDQNLFLAARNLMTVKVITPESIGPINLLSHENVLMTEAAVKKALREYWRESGAVVSCLTGAARHGKIDAYWR